MSALAPRPRLSKALIVLAAAAVAIHLFGLYRPVGPPSPSWFPNADKVEHLVGFGVPVLLILVARSWSGEAAPSAKTRQVTLVVVGVFALHAVVSELIQHFFYISRTGDPSDVLADWSGVALGGVAAWLVIRRRASLASGSEQTGGDRVRR